MTSNNWTLSGGELENLLLANRIPVAPSSPLATLTRAEKTGGVPVFPRAIAPELRRAIEFVAQPQLEIGLLLNPSESHAVNWFYGDLTAPGKQFVGYHRDPADNHKFFWAQEEELAQSIRACLQLNVATESGGVLLDLSIPTFQTLLSLIDCNRELVLESLLQRAAVSERIFTATRVYETFLRSQQTEDLRWLLSLARTTCSFDFRLTPNECDRGLRELVARRLLEPKLDGYLMPPPMTLLCATLALPLAYCAFHKRRFMPSERTEQENVIALRCPGSLWLIQSEALHSDKPRVRLSDATNEQLELTFLEKLHEWQPTLSTKANLKVVAIGEQLCTSCHKPVLVDAVFCHQCGTDLRRQTLSEDDEITHIRKRVEKPAALEKKKSVASSVIAQKKKSPVIHCPTCKAVSNDPTFAFCIACGSRLDQPVPQPVACTNPACGQPVEPGRKFCVFCGQSVTQGAATPVNAEKALGAKTGVPGKIISTDPVARPCPRCGKSIPNTKRFCTACGLPMG